MLKSFKYSHPDTERLWVSVRKCRTEPRLENGHIAQLKGGMRLSAECLPFYKLEGPAEIRCVMGKWTELPVCKREY